MQRVKITTTVFAAIQLILATSAAAHPAPGWARKGDFVEKCLGVAKKGKNDCTANNHGCAGLATTDNDANEWVYTPQGLCEKIGGKIKQKIKVK